jgi:hypothetical protein
MPRIGGEDVPAKRRRAPEISFLKVRERTPEWLGNNLKKLSDPYDECKLRRGFRNPTRDCGRSRSCNVTKLLSRFVLTPPQPSAPTL